MAHWINFDITTICLQDFPGLHHMRIPVCNSASPTEADFDILVQTLVGTTINCPVIISDQVDFHTFTCKDHVLLNFETFGLEFGQTGLF